MQRIIAYIYRYKGEGNVYRKCGNVGFCRVEEIGGRRIINMCFKETHDITRECEIKGLHMCNSEENNICKCGYGQKIRNDTISGGQMRLKVQGEKEDGLCILCGDEKYIVLWNGDKEAILIDEAKENSVSIMLDEASVSKEVIKNNNVDNKKIQKKYDESCAVTSNNEIKLEYEQLERAYNRMAKVPMIIEDAVCQVVKMKPQQMIMLPRKYWRLTNNQFVMDSVYVHKHIIFLKYNNKFVLGAPSREVDEEDKFASIYGFSKKLQFTGYGRNGRKQNYWIMYLN